MKWFLLVLLAGCASPMASAPDSFNASTKEPRCARECLGQYAICTSNAGSTPNRIVTGDILTACQANTRQCLATCPEK